MNDQHLRILRALEKIGKAPTRLVRRLMWQPLDSGRGETPGYFQWFAQGHGAISTDQTDARNALELAGLEALGIDWTLSRVVEGWCISRTPRPGSDGSCYTAFYGQHASRAHAIAEALEKINTSPR